VSMHDRLFNKLVQPVQPKCATLPSGWPAGMMQGRASSNSSCQGDLLAGSQRRATQHTQQRRALLVCAAGRLLQFQTSRSSERTHRAAAQCTAVA
jgi:hypothetical protein